MTDASAQRPLVQNAAYWGEFAEQLDYHSIWASEGWGADAFVTLTEIATATEDIGVGTAIANVFSRSPAVLAMATSSLDRVSDGRAILGVGASHRATVEGLHGEDFERPVRRVHETIELLQDVFDGTEDTVSYDGEVVSMEPTEPMAASIPIYNAALGPANLRATGRVADGWIPHLVPHSTLDDSFATIERTAREAGRDPDEITVAPQVLTAVSDDPDEVRQLTRQFVADYIGRKPAYRHRIASAYPDATERVLSDYETDGVDATAAIPDEMLDDLVVAGTPAYARDRLRNLLENPLVDLPIVFVPKQADTDTIETTLEQLAPSRL